MRTKRSRRRDETALSRRRDPEIHTLYSKDVRADLLVGSPRVSHHERPVWQGGRRAAEQRVYVHYFPVKIRFSWASEPTRVIDVLERETLVEAGRELSAMPRGRVYDVANEAFDDFVGAHVARRSKYVDWDEAGRAVHITWDEPPVRHALAGSGERARGQAVPPAVKLRIRLLLQQAENARGFEAQSAYEKAQDLIRHYGVSDAEVQSLTAQRAGSRGRQLGASEIGRLPPRRDVRRKRLRRAR